MKNTVDSGTTDDALVPSHLRHFEKLLWAIAVACGTVGVFWLPWNFPSTVPAMSESYAVGFNNRIAVLSLAAAIATATVAQLVRRKPPRGIEWLAEGSALLPSWNAARAEYFVLAVCTFIWTQVLWNWGTFMVDPAYGDSRGAIYGMDLVAIGRVPYRDFVFNYGAAHIYLPYWLSWATGGLVSFERAYLLTLLVFVVVGFCSIFVFLRSLRIRRSWRPFALALALVSWFLLHTTTAHVSTRFMSVPLGLVMLHAALRRKIESAALAAWSAAAVSCGVVAYCLALSPEMGIAACLAVSGYAFGLAVLQKRLPAAAACVIGSIAAVAGTLLIFPEYFLTVLAFTSGFGNLPVYPNPQNSLVVATSVFVLSSFAASALRNPSDTRSPLAIGLAAGGGLLLVGSFGRASPPHVFFNSMIPVLVMFAAASRFPPLASKVWCAVYFLVEIVLLQTSWWSTSYGTYNTAIQLRRFYDANPQVVSAWREQWDARRAAHPSGSKLHWDSVLPYPGDLDAITARETIIQTGGSEWNLWLGRYLLLQRETPRDFFTPWLLTACTPEQIERRLQDLRKARYLLVPEGDFALTEGSINLDAYEQNLNRWLGVAMTFPVRTKVRFPPYFPDTIQIQALSKDYKPIGRFQFFMYMPFVLLEKRDGP